MPTSADALSLISALIDQVQEACASDRNKARGQKRPSMVFGFEEPIAWTHIFPYDFRQYCTDPLMYFEYQLKQKLWRFEQFPEDECGIAPDIGAWFTHYPDYTVCGMTLEFTSRGVPILQTDHPLTRDPDLSVLPKTIDFRTSGQMPRFIKWYDDLVEIAAGRVPVHYSMVWGRGVLDIAMQLRGFENLITDAADRPQFVHDLMQWIVDARCKWYDGYYEYFGLEKGPVGFGDDWINVPYISPSFFRDFVLPYYLQIEAHHGGIASIHSCGDQVPVQQYFLQVMSLRQFEVSPWTDLTKTLQNIPPDRHLYRFLHPNDVLFQSPAEIEQQLRFTVDSCRGRSYAIGTSGLTPIADDVTGFVAKVNQWIGIAGRIAEEEMARA